MSIRLAGAPNFRDFGGHRTVYGRSVRRGVLFRSGALAQLNAMDLELLALLGVRRVYDLRSAYERAMHRSCWPADPDVRVQTFDVSADLQARNEGLLEFLRSDLSPRGARRLMLETYRTLPEACAAVLGTLFADIAEMDSPSPLIVNCAAGKDRTGFVCAALLAALDTPFATIEADYLLSAERCDLERLAAQVAPLMQALLGRQIERGVIDALNRVEPEYLEASFKAIVAQYGSLDRYLQDRCGLSAERRQLLHNRLLEQAST